MADRKCRLHPADLAGPEAVGTLRLLGLDEQELVTAGGEDVPGPRTAQVRRGRMDRVEASLDGRRERRGLPDLPAQLATTGPELHPPRFPASLLEHIHEDELRPCCAGAVQEGGLVGRP